MVQMRSLTAEEWNPFDPQEVAGRGLQQIIGRQLHKEVRGPVRREYVNPNPGLIPG